MPDALDLSPHQRQFIRLAQYNTWFNGELYRHSATLSDEERKRDRGAFFKSIHDTLDHILLCDRMWLGRIERSALPFPSLTNATLSENTSDLGSGITAHRSVFSYLSISHLVWVPF